MKKINKMKRYLRNVKNEAESYKRMLLINKNGPYYSELELAGVVGSIMAQGFNYRLESEMVAKYGPN